MQPPHVHCRRSVFPFFQVNFVILNVKVKIHSDLDFWGLASSVRGNEPAENNTCHNF